MQLYELPAQKTVKDVKKSVCYNARHSPGAAPRLRRGRPRMCFSQKLCFWENARARLNFAALRQNTAPGEWRAL
ncbi:MAG: hypothetical protein DBY09_04690 [Selenomonadales bacterium]|nr:MAG: hypothetical protein DBY09_04690 [Selenomonadales bacterium]